MGWGSGSGVMDEVIEELKSKIDDFGVRQTIYGVLITVFENNDCDTLGDCNGYDDAFDKAYAEAHPEDAEEDEDLDDLDEEEDGFDEEDDEEEDDFDDDDDAFDEG